MLTERATLTTQFQAIEYSIAVSAGKRMADALGILSGLTIQLSIKNVFNTSPPFDAYFAPFYYSPYGDVRLRDYFLGVKKQF